MVFDIAESRGVPVADLYQDWILRPHSCLWMTRTDDRLHIHFAINLHNAHWYITAGKSST